MTSLENTVDPVRRRGARDDSDAARASSPAVDDPRGTHGCLAFAPAYSAIESEIIPRFLLASRDGGREGRVPDPDDVSELARIVVLHDLPTARCLLASIQREGASLEAVLLDLVAPAARLLGELWADDRCSFSEVTIGLTRLQTLALDLGAALPNSVLAGWRGQVLLSPVPGEQHTLGPRIVGDFLQRDGWDVIQLQASTGPELLRLVRDGWMDMVGLSISNDALLPELKELVASVRQASANPEVKILVGGGCFLDASNIPAVGADACPSDARAVVEFMREVFERTPRARQQAG